MGTFNDRADVVRDLDKARRLPSFQLVGRSDHRSLDLGVLQDSGVRLVGRSTDARGGRMEFADDLTANVVAADAKQQQILDRIDAHILESGLDSRVDSARTPRPVRPAPAPRSLDLRAEGIRTVLWATGYRPSYPWLEVPILDGQGELRHRGGITPAPGLYVLGLRFLRRRNSNFIDGVGRDARELSAHLAARLARSAA